MRSMYFNNVLMHSGISFCWWGQYDTVSYKKAIGFSRIKKYFDWNSHCLAVLNGNMRPVVVFMAKKISAGRCGRELCKKKIFCTKNVKELWLKTSWAIYPRTTL